MNPLQTGSWLRKLRSVTDSDDFDIAERLAVVEELQIAMYNTGCVMV